MSQTLAIDDRLRDYLRRVGARETPAMARCREETQAGDRPNMQISPEQGAFMQTVAAMTGARRAIEIGVFTGYSAMAVAGTMKARHGADCRLIACDIDAAVVEQARGYWREAGLDDVIEARIGPAADTLKALIEAGGSGTFDLAFIDADKTGYGAYYELCLTLLRPGGVMLLDNMLWSGRVADPTETGPDTVALRELAARIHADGRVDMTLASIGDGVSIAVKR